MNIGKFFLRQSTTSHSLDTKITSTHSKSSRPSFWLLGLYALGFLSKPTASSPIDSKTEPTFKPLLPPTSSGALKPIPAYTDAKPKHALLDEDTAEVSVETQQIPFTLDLPLPETFAQNHFIGVEGEIADSLTLVRPLGEAGPVKRSDITWQKYDLNARGEEALVRFTQIDMSECRVYSDNPYYSNEVVLSDNGIAAVLETGSVSNEQVQRQRLRLLSTNCSVLATVSLGQTRELISVSINSQYIGLQRQPNAMLIGTDETLTYELYSLPLLLQAQNASLALLASFNTSVRSFIDGNLFGLGKDYGVYMDSLRFHTFALTPPFSSTGFSIALETSSPQLVFSRFRNSIFVMASEGNSSTYRIHQDGSFQALQRTELASYQVGFKHMGGVVIGSQEQSESDAYLISYGVNRLVSFNGFPIKLRGTAAIQPGTYNLTLKAFNLSGEVVQSMRLSLVYSLISSSSSTSSLISSRATDESSNFLTTLPPWSEPTSATKSSSSLYSSDTPLTTPPPWSPESSSTGIGSLSSTVFSSSSDFASSSSTGEGPAVKSSSSSESSEEIALFCGIVGGVFALFGAGFGVWAFRKCTLRDQRIADIGEAQRLAVAFENPAGVEEIEMSQQEERPSIVVIHEGDVADEKISSDVRKEYDIPAPMTKDRRTPKNLLAHHRALLVGVKTELLRIQQYPSAVAEEKGDKKHLDNLTRHLYVLRQTSPKIDSKLWHKLKKDIAEECLLECPILGDTLDAKTARMLDCECFTIYPLATVLQLDKTPDGLICCPTCRGETVALESPEIEEVVTLRQEVHQELVATRFKWEEQQQD